MCSKVAFIFQLDGAFIHMFHPYFTAQTIARLAVFNEVYYILTRRYGRSAFVGSDAQAFAIKTRA